MIEFIISNVECVFLEQKPVLKIYSEISCKIHSHTIYLAVDSLVSEAGWNINKCSLPPYHDHTEILEIRNVISEILNAFELCVTGWLSKYVLE